MKPDNKPLLHSRWQFVFSIFIVVMIMIVLSTDSSFAGDDTIVHQGMCGDISWRIDSSGTLYIEGEGEFKHINQGSFVYDKYGNPIFAAAVDGGWSQYSDEIVHAKVRVSGCTSMSGLLEDLPNLKTADFTGSDTSTVKLFTCMFSIQPDVDDEGWHYPTSLEYVDLSGLDTSSLVDCTQMFFYCVNLKSVDLTGWDTSNVTSFQSMFDFCHSLEEVKGIEDFNTESVEIIETMFQHCYVLRSLDLSRWDTSSLEDMYAAFWGCRKLSGALKILNNKYYDDPFSCAFSDPESLFTLIYVENKVDKDVIDALVATADESYNGISVQVLTEPNGHICTDWYVWKEPDCLTQGIEQQKCKVCGEITDIKIIPAIGHNWEEWIVIIPATENTSGTQSRTCTVCGYTETQVIPQITSSVAPTAPVEIIDLPTVKISKPAPAKKSVTIKWKKVNKKNLKKIQGLEIQVATDPEFTNIVKTAISGKKKTSKKIKGLVSKQTYYVRIRAYKNAADGKHVSTWKVKKIKIK